MVWRTAATYAIIIDTAIGTIKKAKFAPRYAKNNQAPLAGDAGLLSGGAVPSGADPRPEQILPHATNQKVNLATLSIVSP